MQIKTSEKEPENKKKNAYGRKVSLLILATYLRNEAKRYKIMRKHVRH